MGAVPLALRATGRPQESRGEREVVDAGLPEETLEWTGTLPPLAPSGRIADELAPRGTPLLVARADGTATLVCVVWTPGRGDRIEVRDDLQPDGAGRPARFVSERFAEILEPCGVVDATGRLCLFWTQLVEGSAQLFFAREQ